MSGTKRILLLPGDGIGPEVMAEVERVVEWTNRNLKLGFAIERGLVGGCSIDAHGIPLSDATLRTAMEVDAVLLGAVGGPKWNDIPFERRPEAGLLQLRKKLGLFANLRPSLVFDALADASPLKRPLVEGLDILIVRELTGGVYFGEPRGIESLPNGEQRGVNTHIYTTSEIVRVARVAFEMARKRARKVHSVEKGNVMDAGLLWRRVVHDLHAREFPDVALLDMYADNCAMQLVRNPKQFDIILTDNLFGDILSDEAAMVAGSLGLLPSASLGALEDGRRRAMYEPAHGSAPDIAGKGVANPLAALMSYAMMLDHSFNRGEDASRLMTAIRDVLERGIRTADLGSGPGIRRVSTAEMGMAVVDSLARQYERHALKA